MRVAAYEIIVPPITAVLMLAGFVVANRTLGDHAPILESFVLIMTVGTIWSVVCAAGTLVIFDFWCRPVSGLFGQRRRPDDATI